MLRLTFFLAMMFTILVASIFRTPMIVFMAALMCATLATGFVLGRRANRGLVVTRTMPEVGLVGDVVSGRIVVHNMSKWPGFFIHLHAGQVVSSAGGSAANSKRSHGKRPGEENSSGISPFSPVAIIGSAEHTVPLLPPGESISWESQWRLQRRGVYRLSPVRAGSGDPLGMFNASQPHTGTLTITILPRPIKLHRLGFLGGADVGLRAPQHATAVTEAMDFHGIRLWHPGEGMRRVHWKSTARTGNIHVVEWEENLATDLTVLLDTQVTTARNGTPRDGRDDIDEAWEAAVTMTASIADYLLENGFRFELFCWQRPPTTPLPIPSTSSDGKSAAVSAPEAHETANIQLCYHRAYNANGIGETLKMLAQIEPLTEDTATLSSLARRAAPRIERGGSVVIISTTRADVAGALQTLESSAPRGTNGYAIVLDAESFDVAPGGPEPKSGYRMRPRHARRATTAASVSTFSPTATMRLVRRGDSLADALELA
jgi:hypothetical protein